MGRGTRKTILLAVTALVVSVLALSCRAEEAPDATPAADRLSSELREAVSPGGIMVHARRLQASSDEHGGNRAAGTPGYDASAAYVAGRLRRAGYEVQAQSFELPGYTTVRDAELDVDRTTNIIAQTPGGDADETVVVGAHLDSVPEGPGINDNGSGSATVLEIALRLAEVEAKPRNRVRFAFWGAEEIGLVGSRHYVAGLGDEEVEEISAYLNFDMVGSPNPVNTIYDGPDEIEEVFASYFEGEGIAADSNAALDGRSDHGPFQDEGIPTGGLFSGAGGTKTERQQEIFGGEAGVPFDACYHRACDDLDNLSEESLDRLSDAAAHATAVLAQREGP